MLNTITLQHAQSSLTLAPEIGGSIVDFCYAGQSVFRPVDLTELEASRNVRITGCYPLVPFSNRIAYGQFDWKGKSYQLQPNFGDSPHTIHGNGWQNPWQSLDPRQTLDPWQTRENKPCVQTDQKNQITFFFEHTAPKEDETTCSWPFAFRAEQTFILNDNSLTLNLSITNLSAEIMPCGLGWHPFFQRTPQTSCFFDAQSIWENDSNMLPINEQQLNRQILDQLFMPLGTIPTKVIDNCFTQWGKSVVIEQPEFARRIIMQTAVESKLDYLVVFTPEHGRFIAVEPITHRNAALNEHDPIAHGIQVLSPGENLQVSCTIQVQTIKSVASVERSEEKRSEES